jgi:hypothetical protein
MKKLALLVSIVIFISFFSCQKEKADSTEEVTQHAEESGGALLQFSDDYLVSIYEAQELIKIDHDNREMRQRYCEQALQSSGSLFISMGIGRLHQPDGKPIPRHLAERAAKLDAMRWAGYGSHWIKEDFEPPFGKLQSTMTYQTEIINQAVVGDSIFVFIASRLPK